MLYNFDWKTVKYQRETIGSYSVITCVKKKEGYLFFNDFLEKFLKEFVKENYLYTYYAKDWAFSYGEKQLNSVIYPVFHKLADACFMEMPILRQKPSFGQGFIDYVVIKNKKYFLIELKHVKIFLNKKSFLRLIKDKWRNVIKQINSLKGKEIAGYKRNKKVYKMGLVVAPIFLDDKDDKDDKNEDLLHYNISKIHQSLKPQPDWFGIVQLKQDFFLFIEGNYCSCPMILVFVYEDITHL